MKTVYVASNEGAEGGGAFDWYPAAADADAEYERLRKDYPGPGRIFRFDVDVHSRGRNNITAEIEQLLMAADFTPLFPPFKNAKSEQIGHIPMAPPDPLTPRGPTGEEEEEHWYCNHYTCPVCSHEWTDEWSAMSDDTCPECNTKNITPTHSEELSDG